MKGRQYAKRDPAIYRVAQLANRPVGAVGRLPAGDVNCLAGPIGTRLECHDFLWYAATPRLALRTHASCPAGTPMGTGILGLEWRGLCVGTRSLDYCSCGL